MLELLRTGLREREPLFSLYQMFSIIIEHARHIATPPASKASSKWWFYDPEHRAATPPTAVSARDLREDFAVVGRERAGGGVTGLEQADMHDEVFVKVRDDGGMDDDYLIAVVTEYFRSLSACGQMAEPELVDFLLRLIVGAEPPRYHVFHQLLQYHVIQDSMQVATRLLELESQYPPALQLALDMSHRLGQAHKVAEVLLARGKLMQAMRYLKDHSQVTIPAHR